MHERVFKRSAFLAAFVMAVVLQVWAQAPPSSTTPAALAVNGDVGTTLSLTPADLESLPRTRVEVKEDGRTLTYEGVLAGEILKRAGVPLGAELRGDAIATFGKFKAPTLRNIAVTAPYMHDGSVATLEDAIEHYAAGGRALQAGPDQGVGRDNPNKSTSIRGFTITAARRADLVAFLQSLTDQALLEDPQFADPWLTSRKPGAK